MTVTIQHKDIAITICISRFVMAIVLWWLMR